MKPLKSITLLFLFSVNSALIAQDITLFQQFNGRYNYTAIGNTLNPEENNGATFCSILDNSSAALNLDTNFTIIKAYLYWAGVGTGDSTVSLNNTPITAQDTYTVTYNDSNYGELTYFSSYADVTSQIITEGNTNYTFANMDLVPALTGNPGYCNNRTNFGGWSIYVIYEDSNLPLNQISLFQGLEIINRNVQEKEITLTNINVLDNIGAKIGFLAWEGDNSLNFGEMLAINNNVLSNPPLNLADNAFNGTNTFTNSTTFYNADLDVYDIEDNIAIGDTEVTIKLTTGDYDSNGFFRADLIIINNIITVLNSQLPDATITANNYEVNCGESSIDLDYTVNNFNSTAALPANTPIAFYANNTIVGQSHTTNTIEIGNSENGSITLNIPEGLGNILEIKLSVDDNGTMQGVIDETNENNNISILNIELTPAPEPIILPNLLKCNKGFETATFNLLDAIEGLNLTNPIFYTALQDVETQQNAITSPEYYTNITNPQHIYVRVPQPMCYDLYQFSLTTENCPPKVPQGFSPNNDGKNDWFNIQGLYDIFTAHQLKIYNRLGVLVYEGTNSKPWNGNANRGITNQGNKVPVGTYFYVLHLNDPNYKSLQGWVYVNY